MSRSLLSGVVVVMLAVALLPVPPTLAQDAPELPDGGESAAESAPQGTPSGVVAEDPEVSWASAAGDSVLTRVQPAPAATFASGVRSVELSTEFQQVGDLPVQMRGEDAGAASIDAVALSGGSPVDQGFAMSWDAAGPVEVAFDLEGLGVAPSADLWERLRLVWCPTPACEADQDIPLSVDLASGQATATLPATVDGSGELRFAAELTSTSGSFDATPLSLVSDYQVGLSSGAAETGYSFDVAPAGAGPDPSVGLAYSSSQIDGMSAARNNQPGVAGLGWSFDPGYVTRHTARCGGTVNGDPRQDRCIYHDEYSITLGGTSSRLFPVDGGTAVEQFYRLEQDPQWRVIRHRAATPDGSRPDTLGEWWEVVQSDGTRFQFGARAYDDGSNAVFSHWIYSPAQAPQLAYCGEERDDISVCRAAWRWQVDRVIDSHGTFVEYDYAVETNHYQAGLDISASSRREYVRAGRLTEVRYNHDEDGSAHSRIQFDYEGRCVDQPCAEMPMDGQEAQYPDVPFDLRCGDGVDPATGPANCDRRGGKAQSFWTALRLSGVRSEILDDDVWSPATAYRLTHLFSDMAEPNGLTPSTNERKLMLSGIQRVATSVSEEAAASLPKPVERIAGGSRIETAIAVSAEGWPEGANTALLATADDFPDAVAAGALAAAQDAPILLNSGGALIGAVEDELDRLGVEEVIVLGGTAAVPEEVEDDLENAGVDVRRLAGESRYTTAAAIALEAGAPAGVVALASGAAFPDALAAGSLAAVTDRIPVVLTQPESLPTESLEAIDLLGADEVIVLGGTSAVDPSVAEAVTDSGVAVMRLAGASRSETATAIAEEAIRREGGGRDVIAATAADFPDALSAAGLANRRGGVVLLTDAIACGSTLQWIANNQQDLSDGAVIGGTAVVPSEVLGAVGAALNDQEAGCLTPVQYGYTLLRNRVSGGGASALPLARLTSIETELGGQIAYTYGTPRACQNDSNPAPETWGRLTQHCFAGWIGQEPDEGDSDFGLYNRWVVTQMVQSDEFSGNEDQVTTYEFGTPAHAYDLTPGLPDVDSRLEVADRQERCPCRQWSDWRGHDWVRVVTANSVTEHRFYQGLSGDRGRGEQSITLSDGTDIADDRWLRGREAEMIRWETGGSIDDPRQRVVTGYSVTETGGRDQVEVDIERVSHFVAPETVTTTTYEGVEADEDVALETISTNTYDAYGNVTVQRVSGTGSEERTNRTWYAPPGDAYLASLPIAVQTSGPDDVVQQTAFGYDGATPPAVTADGPATTPGPFATGDQTSMRTYPGPDPDDPDGAADVVYATTTSYDDAGRPTSVTDPNGHTVRTEYDPIYGNPTRTTNPLGHVTARTYDNRYGLPLTVTDPNRHITTSTYDGLGRVRSVWLPTEPISGPATYRFGYNPTAQPATVTTQRFTTIDTGTDSDGSAPRPRYLVDVALHDGFGRVIQTQAHSSTPGQTTLTSTRFDSVGLAVRSSAAYDVEGQPDGAFRAPDWSAIPSYTQTAHDHFDAPTSVSRRGPAGVELWNETVVRSGWEITTVGPDGQTRIETANAFGETQTVSELGGSGGPATTSYLYDAAGRLTEVADPDGHRTQIGMNWLGWKHTLDDPDAGTWRYVYDDAGQVVSQTDPLSQTLTFEYDEGNRLIRRADGDTDLATFTYSEVIGERGRLQSTTSTTPLGPVAATFSYDDRNRVTSRTWTLPGFDDPFEMAWQYDATDQVTALTYPAVGSQPAETVQNGYDDAGRLVTVEGDDLYLAAAEYDPPGRVRLQELFGDVHRTVTYDPQTLHLNGVTGMRDAETLQSLDYEMDNSARVTSITDAANGGQTQCFAYTGRNELRRAFTGNSDCAEPDLDVGADGFDHTYAYTADGNMTNRGNRTLVYGDDAHPHAVQSATDGYGYTYNAAGNLTERTGPDGDASFGYDVDNRLIQAITDAGTTTYAFDADSHRVLADGPQELTAWLGNDVEVVASDDGTVTMTTRYMAGDQLLAERTGDLVTTMLPDHLGTTVVAIPAGGAPEQLRYDPWGAPRSEDAPFDLVTRGFTSAPTDSETGLVWLSTRAYDPIIGRFTQPDTIVPDPGSAVTLNRFAYMSNNPQGGADPTGHFGPFGAIVGAAVGAVASYGAQVVSNVRDNGFSTQAFTDVEAGPIIRGAVIGAVAGATGGAAAAALGGTSTAAVVGAAGAGGMVGGQAARATGNILDGRPVTDGLLNPTDMVIDGALGIGTFGAAVALRNVRANFSWGMGQLRTSDAGAISASGRVLETATAGTNVRGRITSRPSSWRLPTLREVWRRASQGPNGGRLCMSCDTEVMVPPGTGQTRDWDMSHVPSWTNRIFGRGTQRRDVLNNHNDPDSVGVECRACNRGAGNNDSRFGGNRGLPRGV